MRVNCCLFEPKSQTSKNCIVNRWIFAWVKAAFLLLLYVSSVQPAFGLMPESCVYVKSNVIMASKFTIWLARSVSRSAKSLLIILNLWKCKGQLWFQSAAREMFSVMSVVCPDIDYSDLLSEMSQQSGGLMLDESWNGKHYWTEGYKETY